MKGQCSSESDNFRDGFNWIFLLIGNIFTFTYTESFRQDSGFNFYYNISECNGKDMYRDRHCVQNQFNWKKLSRFDALFARRPALSWLLVAHFLCFEWIKHWTSHTDLSPDLNLGRVLGWVWVIATTWKAHGHIIALFVCWTDSRTS